MILFEITLDPFLPTNTPLTKPNLFTMDDGFLEFQYKVEKCAVSEIPQMLILKESI